MQRFFFGFILLTVFAHFSFAQTNAEDSVKASDKFLIENNYAAAIAEISKAVNLQPNNAAYLLKRAELYFALPNYEAAVADINQAVRLKPDDKFTILTATRFLRNMEKCETARAILDEFIAKHANATDDIFYARSHSKMCLGDWSSAYEDMFRASELAPDNDHYRTTLAGMISKLGDSEKSLEQLGKLIKYFEAQDVKAKAQYPNYPGSRSLFEIYRIRAGIYHSRHDETAEFADLAKAVEALPEDFNYRIRAKIYADHGMFAEAVADYTKALENTRNPAIFLFERGNLFFEMKKYDEAEKDYAAAAEKDSGLKEPAEHQIEWIRRNVKKIDQIK